MRNRIIYTLLFLLSISAVFHSCQNEEGINYKRYYVNGKGIYEKNCQSCHGADGKGLGTLYPPLTDSLYLKQNKNKLACIIKNGQNETIQINNVPFDGNMPANPNLADIDIAQVIVYITNSFGNKQGFYSDQQVLNDLNNCK
ncbi:cytochrome c [Daejeonella sp. H1SJ63]|jgi:mono/diheme cytochrome c family protein|uniref:c-type cytochrome n=1 Tax=Daejeonella sp. H1SJ63 TaxID=3034145 RepID=UPI0023EB1E4E|nr:cytochrome c [Daejeonella sp. H1SJ63]